MANLTLPLNNATARWRLGMLGGLLAVLGLSQAWAAPERHQDAEAYAVRLPVRLAPGASLQRLTVPTYALTAMQSSAYADVRLFNADGLIVPMARLSSTPIASTPPRTTRLKSFALTDDVPASSNGDISVQVQSAKGVDHIKFQMTAAAASSTPATSSANAGLTGVLLDTRPITDPAQALDLELDLPLGKAITISVLSSKDLRSWEAIGQTVLFQATDPSTGKTQIGNKQILLHQALLKEHLLQVRWTDETGQAVKVQFNGAVITSAAKANELEPLKIELTNAQRVSAHEWTLQVPFGVPLQGLNVTPSAEKEWAPYQAFGRNTPEAPWTYLGASVAYSMRSNGSASQGGLLNLPDRTFKHVRILASEKTAGFSAAPRVSVLMAPLQLVFVATGKEPFALATGLVQAPDPYLPMASLIPDYKAGQEHRLPLAEVLAPNGLDLSKPSQIKVEAARPVRSWILWGVLALGTLLLLVMAVGLFSKKNATAGSDSP
jgi:Protein of unknown function (DUF3999)